MVSSVINAYSSSDSVPIRIAQRHKSKFRRRVYNKILRHAADMRHRKTRPHHEFDDKVAIANSPHAVFSNRAESQLLCEKKAVYHERVAGESATPKRQNRNSRD